MFGAQDNKEMSHQTHKSSYEETCTDAVGQKSIVGNSESSEFCDRGGFV